MRVYYISSGLQGCYTYRCLNPLFANGWDGDQTTMLLEQAMKTPENKSYAAQHADVVVFHRPDDPDKLKLARLLKRQGKKIVFDNDDTYKDDGGYKFNKFMDKERLERNLATVNETIDTFIKEADMVTTSTEFLAEEYRKIHKNVVVLPNSVDPFYFDEPKRNQGTALRLGLTGSVGVTSDFPLALELVDATKDKDYQWVLFSMPKDKASKIARELYHEEYKELEQRLDQIEWHGFCDMQDYYEYLNDLKLDVMVIPRADTYFNRCKSNIKFIEASMFEIPVIAQGFPDGKSPYQVDPEDAEHMIIANNKDEFLAGIEKLASNKQERRRMGKRARKYVEKKYDINLTGELWETAYQSLFTRQAK